MIKLFAATGSVLLILSIATGWLIVAKRHLSMGVIEAYIRDDENLAKAHVDYIIMGAVLLILYAVGINFPPYIVVLACLGALSNPSLFAFLSLKPDVNKALGSPFSIVSTLSFLATTVGIGGAACSVLVKTLT